MPVLKLIALSWSALHVVVRGSVTFHSGGPLGNLTLYSPPVTSFIGPQPEDKVDPITRNVVAYAGDLCDMAMVSATTFSDHIVLANPYKFAGAPCSYESMYLNLQSRGAAGIICKLYVACRQTEVIHSWTDSVPSLIDVPGISMFSQDGNRGALTRSVKTMCLQIQPTADAYKTLVDRVPNLSVTMFPDVNVWGAMYSSWYYQLFIRVLPCTILIGSGLLAFVFVVQHTAIMNDRYKEAVVTNRHTLRRRLRYLISIVDLPYIALIIESITATLAGTMLAIDGYLGSGSLSAGVVGFFGTLLNGWSMDCSLVSARLWAKKLTDITPGRLPSLVTRIMLGDYWIATAILYSAPIITDTLFSICLAINYSSAPVMVMGPTIAVLLQIFISSNLIISVVRYHRTVNVIQGAIVDAVPTDDVTSVSRLMKRLSRCALGLAISMLISCTGTLIIGLAPTLTCTPNGFAVAIALFYNGRAMDSAFRVIMMQPRQRDSVHRPTGKGPGTCTPPVLVAPRRFKATILATNN